MLPTNSQVEIPSHLMTGTLGILKVLQARVTARLTAVKSKYSHFEVFNYKPISLSIDPTKLTCDHQNLLNNDDNNNKDKS